MAYGTNYGDGGSTGWQTEMITLFRYVINDVDETQEFTDNRLGLSLIHI